MVGYTQKSDPETTARAIGRELPISPRHSIAICRHIKGWRLEAAKDFLAEVIELKTPVPDTRFGGAADQAPRGRGPDVQSRDGSVCRHGCP